MPIIAETDWVTGETTYNPAAMDPAQIWRSAVALAATKARQVLPACSTRIDKAIELVLHGAVELLENGHALVQSQHSPGAPTYHLTNGTYDCADFPKAPQSWCKHRLAHALTVKAMQLAKELGQAATPVTLSPGAGVLDEAPAAGCAHEDYTPTAGHPLETIPAQCMVEIQGKPFVTFHGLLALAHQQGLVSLKASFISVTPDLALAHAVATFSDGRVFEDCGDATPGNVNSRVAKHFARCALTRAKARALRDALNIASVCAEELD